MLGIARVPDRVCRRITAVGHVTREPKRMNAERTPMTTVLKGITRMGKCWDNGNQNVQKHIVPGGKKFDWPL